MGFLTEGNTFEWDEINSRPIDLVHKHGLIQFINIYNSVKDRSKDCLKYGDEVEYLVLKVDDDEKKIFLSLHGHSIVDQLEEECSSEPPPSLNDFNDDEWTPIAAWRPEYGRHMIEGLPGVPYGHSGGTSQGMSSLVLIEQNMKVRRNLIESKLKNDEMVITMPNYPMLGAVQFGQYTSPETSTGGPVAFSHFTSDDLIHPHWRFSTLTRNIRHRRGSKVDIRVPLFKDLNTTSDPLPIPDSQGDLLPKLDPYTIYMDSMAFGMGCCCLQVTFQCCNISEARLFSDQCAVLTPLLLALTAGAPIFRGYLADIDARWQVISASVDCRTEEERGLVPLKDNRWVINKSRYDSIDCFISDDPRLDPVKYNDLDLVLDQDACDFLMKEGVDELLARHIAHLFIRDPLVIYRDKLLLDDKLHSDHFENIQSTNWQTVRFKPPPPLSDMGWRVEFRPMEIQFTDFENSAFSVFVVLLSRVISVLSLNFYMPISLVDENMRKAQNREAIKNEKFWFRTDYTSDGYDEPQLQTMDQIMNGNSGQPGVIGYMKILLDTITISPELRNKIDNYLDFISARASGKLLTPAMWIRNFVLNHPEYQQDSVVTHRINYDLLKKIHSIGRGEAAPDLLGDYPNRFPV